MKLAQRFSAGNQIETHHFLAAAGLRNARQTIYPLDTHSANRYIYINTINLKLITLLDILTRPSKPCCFYTLICNSFASDILQQCPITAPATPMFSIF
ncbi:MAG: hypothetical protein JWO13_1408 [Acidobacteriales bacterium]|nr:hypothetical protein [Terriglobales bacterium]